MIEVERMYRRTPLDEAVCRCRQTVPLRVRRRPAEVEAVMIWLARALAPRPGLVQVLAMAHTTYHDHCHWCGRPATCTVAVAVANRGIGIGIGIERLACPAHAHLHGKGVES
jgi:hypothetical protein